MNESRWVVVQRGVHFETAEVSAVGPSHAELRGSWPAGGFGKTTTLIVDDLEVPVQVFHSDAGTIVLRPTTGALWPTKVQRALDRIRQG